MADNAKWYVIHTYSGYENKVKQNIEKVVENRKLHDLICEIRIPMESYTEVKEAKKVEAERKLFPSYVLVKMVMTDDSWYVVRNTLGVETGAMTVEVDYSVGDNVVVTTGSFEGFRGVVSSIDLEAQTVEVVVSMFGRETPVSLPISQIKAED